MLKAIKAISISTVNKIVATSDLNTPFPLITTFRCLSRITAALLDNSVCNLSSVSGLGVQIHTSLVAAKSARTSRMIIYPFGLSLTQTLKIR